jgi:hypothetical protein
VWYRCTSCRSVPCASCTAERPRFAGRMRLRMFLMRDPGIPSANPCRVKSCERGWCVMKSGRIVIGVSTDLCSVDLEIGRLAHHPTANAFEVSHPTRTPCIRLTAKHKSPYLLITGSYFSAAFLLYFCFEASEFFSRDNPFVLSDLMYYFCGITAQQGRNM